MPNQYTALPMPERFWSKVDRSGPIPQNLPDLGQCWLWTGSLDTPGYGHINIDGVLQKSSRVAWGLAGSPAGALHVLHVCDVRRCVRNDTRGIYEVNGVRYERRGHLWLGTNAANAADKEAKGRGGQRGRPGTENSAAKLTPDQVLEIRALFDQGLVHKAALARRFGVTFMTITYIVRRVTWQHI